MAYASIEMDTATNLATATSATAATFDTGTGIGTGATKTTDGFTVTTAGDYKVEFNYQYSSTTTRHSVMCQLVLNGTATGIEFSDYARTGGLGPASVAGTYMLTLGVGDTLGVEGTRTGASSQGFVTGEGNLMITQLS